jgi:hypothetical protein
MKVYMVYRTDDEGMRFDGIFSSRENAERYIEQRVAKVNPIHGTRFIERYRRDFEISVETVDDELDEVENSTKVI